MLLLKNMPTPAPATIRDQKRSLCWRLLFTALALFATAAQAQAPPQKLLDLINDPWRVVWQDSTGHQVRRYEPDTTNVVYLFEPDAAGARVMFGYVDGGCWFVNPRTRVDPLFEAPCAWLSIPDSVWTNWDSGPGWRFRLEDSIQPVLVGLRFFPFTDPREP